VESTTPAGTPFAIQGLSFRGVEEGFGPGEEVDFSLTAREKSDDGEELGTGPVRRLYRWSLGVSCPPSEWAIVYGRLTRSGASVTANTAAGPVPLSVLALPSRLHAHGTLAYGAFAQIPASLTIRDVTGRIIGTESLAKQGAEHHEFCEGYAEP
jgi:hypothetical protein